MDINESVWEPRYSTGPRVELSGGRFICLWMSEVILDTAFEVTNEGEETVLLLEERSLSYPDQEPYADLARVSIRDGVMYLEQDHRISGPSTQELVPTENSRYGNVTLITDEVLPLLQGDWTDGSCTLHIKGTVLSGDLVPEPVVFEAVRRNSCSADRVWLIDRDPAVHSVGRFEEMWLEGDRLVAHILVCDGPQLYIEFDRC